MTQPFVVDFDPVAFGIGPFHLPWIGQVHPQVHWYGLMYLLGFLGAWILGERRRRLGRLPVSRNAFGDLMFYAMMGVIIGGRVWYMLSYQPLSWIWTRPLELFQIWDGGMSFHGGLMGVVLAGWWWSRRNGVHPFDTVDFVAPLVPIGLGLGRIGNFINGELWGKLTHQPWGMIFPNALREASRCALESPSWRAAHWYCTKYSMQQLDQARAFVGDTTEQIKALAHSGALNSFAREPSQLMESFLEGVVMFTVLYIYSRKPRRRYAVSGLFALMYGVFRFSIEFVRDPDPQLGYLLGTHWLTMGQVQSIPLVVIGVFLLWLSRRQPQPAAA